MKPLLLFLCLSTGVLAAPPTSLEGLIYRDQGGPIQLRTGDELSLEFTSPTMVRSLLWWQTSLIDGRIVGYHAPVSGSYSYEKIAENEYRLTLTDAPSGLNTVLLHFQTDVSGSFERNVHLGTQDDESQPTYKSYGTFVLQPRPDDTRRVLVAVSTRAVAKAGDPLIVGFVIPGGWPKTQDVLIRVVGPGLASQGVPDYWTEPTYYLSHPKPNTGDDQVDRFLSDRAGTWSSTPEAQATSEQAFLRAGAFPLAPASRDLADVVRLAPGAYTVVILPPTNSPGGTVLVEVYEL